LEPEALVQLVVAQLTLELLVAILFLAPSLLMAVAVAVAGFHQPLITMRQLAL
jgi:hypothetical protein